MTTPRYHRHARADLEVLWQYLAQDNIQAADQYLDGLQEAAHLYAANPGMYKSLKNQFGEELFTVLTAWGGLQERGFTLEHFDGLYTPCGLELLDPKHRGKGADRENSE